MALSRLANAEGDGPANESDRTRMIKMDRDFSLCILLDLPPKTSRHNRILYLINDDLGLTHGILVFWTRIRGKGFRIFPLYAG
jgi:hypothetical protein